MNKKLITVVFLLNTLLLLAQKPNLSISGYVKDVDSKEVLIGANIFVKGSKIGVSTNEYGFFSLNLPHKDTNVLYISFIGYETQKQTILSKSISDRPYVFELKEGLELQAVLVSDSEPNHFVRQEETSVTKLDVKQIKKLPNLFGEVDIVKALQLMPGVQSGGEGKSSLYVRGGSPDQNLYLLDDVPLYYVGHFSGFLSVFNADAINSVKMIKGGFPARFGSRLSSVLDVKMKEGNMNQAKYQGSIGLLSSKMFVSAPLIKNKSSFMVSVRGNIIPLFRMLGAPLNYHFYDANAKANYIFSDKDRVFFSFYMGDDFLWVRHKHDETKFKSLIKWGNTLGALRWNHIYNSRLFSNLTVSNTYYRYKTNMKYHLYEEGNNKKIRNQLTSGINDLSAKLDYAYYYNKNIDFKFGLNSTYHIFTPNNEVFEASGDKISSIDSLYSSKTEAWENSVYLENHFKYRLFSANLGARLSSYHIGKQNYISLEPRILLNYILREDMALKYSFSKMNQYVHLLSYSGTGVPNDYWMPTTENIKPESSIQHTLSFNKTFFDHRFELSLEAYHKAMNHLITFAPGQSLLGNLSNWENLVETGGAGENYGIELFLQKKKGKTTGWIGATIAKAYRQFDNINDGERYVFKYDRLFDVSIVATHQLKKHIDISATWTYGSGYPITLAHSKYRDNERDVLIFDKKNAYRMRDYHRLDVAVNFRKKTKKGERTWTISIFNLYNRRNPYYYYYAREDLPVFRGTGTPPQPNFKLYQRSLFSFLPSVAYSFKF